uniref:Uncharacterized protein n=1 Tax=mine drainage metagenome TaxID=410659 RepID=E6QKD6_9ZZZZ
MKKIMILSLLLAVSTLALRADIVVLHDGRSYSGVFAGAPDGKLVFKDNQGIQYTFPIADVQSLVFSNLADHISLRTGHSYRGQLVGITSLKFNGSNGVSYVFPLNDVSSLIFTEDGAPNAGMPSQAGAARSTMMGGARANGARGQAAPTASIIVPSGTQISVRTDVPIDTTKDTAGQLYDATIQNDVTDSMGAVSIPAGTRARLQVIDASKGGIHGQAYALDLASINVNGVNYRVDSSSIGGQEGVGLNKRTALFGGGGLALGSLLGAAFGGGQGAAIGAVAGGLGGLGTQLFTHGKTVKVPAETVLSFQLQQTLVLHP